MTEPRRIAAATMGNPGGGLFDNPWPPGSPAVGQRVAVFAYEVTKVDGVAADARSFHVAPVETAAWGPIGPSRDESQGIEVAWRGCGTGTVVRARGADERTCDVTPDSRTIPWGEDDV
ncbi:hypothetical protein [Amycolatopsis silviterrae]|uniref:Uncharacterized protein n=1 Tax=Amycolatopsis silviterrae TaxID=1656914 RepID=A0ABW5H2M8_9PSEU